MGEPPTDASERIRLVLRADVTAQDVDDAALDVDWLLVRHWDGSDQRPYEDQYVDRTERTTISFLDDTYLGLRYLVVRGPDAAAVADEARGVVPTVSFDEALSALRGATAAADRAAAVPAVALAAGSQDQDRAIAALRAAADAGDDGVRRAVIRASTYVGWPGLRDLLGDLRATAADPQVRRLAGVALEGLAIEDGSRPP